MENEKNASNNVAPQTKEYTIWRMLRNVFVIVAVTLIVYFFSPLEIVTVSSSTMEPTLPVGSVSVAIKTDETTKYKVGDIITFSVEYGGTYYSRVTHRIVAIEGDTIQTKGDNISENDPFTIHKSQIRNRLKWNNIFNISLLSIPSDTDTYTGEPITAPACTDKVCDIKE